MELTVTFYYPGMYEVRSDGTIAMRATGHEGGWRWTGERTFRPDASHYEFWRWIISQRERWTVTPFFSSEDLPMLKQEFENRAP